MPSPVDDPSDAERLSAYATELADAVEAALPGWVVRCVEQRVVEGGGTLAPGLLDEARTAGLEAAEVVGPSVRSLLSTDIDEQRENPLALLRAAVRYPTTVLRRAGLPRRPRDRDAVTLFPDDDYDLVPASFADLDPSLHDVGIRWGAAKAHVHLARRRREAANDAG